MDMPYHAPSLSLAWLHNHKSTRLAAREHLSPRLKEVALLDPAAALAALDANPGGLTEADAVNRLTQHGPNVVTRERRLGIAQQFVMRLFTPLNIMLLGLAFISYLLGDPRAAIVIAVMVALSFSLSFIQEYRSNRAAQSLRALVRTTAAVARRHEPDQPAASPQEIPLEQLVPGDIVSLAAGDIVPADLRVITAKDLFLNQAALTGEALPLEKYAKAERPDIADPLDCINLCFMGTNRLLKK
jgi:Mg2+-importing ATPase